MCKIEDWQRKKILMSNDNAPFRKDVNKTGGKPILCQTSVYTLIRFISFKILKELKGDASREPVRRINLKLQKGSLMELSTTYCLSKIVGPTICEGDWYLQDTSWIRSWYFWGISCRNGREITELKQFESSSLCEGWALYDWKTSFLQLPSINLWTFYVVIQI